MPHNVGIYEFEDDEIPEGKDNQARAIKLVLWARNAFPGAHPLVLSPGGSMGLTKWYLFVYANYGDGPFEKPTPPWLAKVDA
jgi:hypothetical protein